MPARDLRDQDTQPSTGPTPVTPELQLQQIAVELVLADYESAKLARDQRDYGQTSKGEHLDFDKWLKELKDLYFGRRQAKTVPWQYCSNRSLMIAMAILDTLHSRLFPAIYNEELTKWRPAEITDEETAVRVEKFMFWWVRVHAKLREFFDRWVRYTIGFGSTLSITRWDVHLLDKGETSPASSVVNPDGTVTVIPEEKILDRWETSCSDIIPLEDVFLQAGATNLQRDTLCIRRRYLYRDLEDMEREGKVVNVTMPTVEGQFPLQHFLPVPSVAAAGLSPEQQAEVENIRRRNLPVECLEWWGGIDLDQDGFPEQHRLLICPQHRLFLGAVPVSSLSKRGLRPIDLTLFEPRLDEPNGQFGIGILEKVKELALEIDACFNQLTDANSISILRPIFYRTGGDIDPAALKLAPNKMIGTGGTPQQDVYIPDFNIPTDRLLLAIRLVLEFVERLTAASAYVMGKESEIVGGSGTATRTEAIVGASNQRHSIPVQRLREGAARILTQHLDLIQKRASEPDGFLAFIERRVLGERGEPLFAGNELASKGLEGEFDAYLLPDESMGSKESERQLAQLLYTMALGNPIIMSDMTKLYKVTADFYTAFGKDAELYLGIAPDVKQTDRPEDENTMILEGQVSSVQASLLDNDLEHIISHQTLFQSPVFLALPPDMQAQITQFAQAHIQQHMAMMSMKMQLANQQPKGAQSNGKPSSGKSSRNGTAGGGAGSAAPVGPEPGMGALQSPRAQAGGIQRTGESQGTP